MHKDIPFFEILATNAILRALKVVVNRVFRLSLLAAAPAMLAGHALAGRIGTALWGVPEHAAYLHAIEYSLVLPVAFIAVFSLLALLGSAEPKSQVNPQLLFLALLGAQLLAYITLEGLEHHPAGWLGFTLQVICAILATGFIRALGAWFDSCRTLGAVLIGAHRSTLPPHNARMALAYAPIIATPHREFTRRSVRPPPHPLRHR